MRFLLIILGVWEFLLASGTSLAESSSMTHSLTHLKNISFQARACPLPNDEYPTDPLLSRDNCTSLVDGVAILDPLQNYAIVFEVLNLNQSSTEMILSSSNPLISFAKVYQRALQLPNRDISQARLSDREPSFLIDIPGSSTSEIIFVVRYTFFGSTKFSLLPPNFVSSRGNQTNYHFADICFGLLIGLFIYNFFLFFSLKERSYLSNAQYLGILCLCLLILDGTFWTLTGKDIGSGFLVAHLNFLNYFALNFLRDLFHLSRDAQRIDTYFRLTGFISLGLGFLLLVGFQIDILTLVSETIIILSVLASLATALYIGKKTGIQTWPYIFSWVLVASSFYLWKSSLIDPQMDLLLLKNPLHLGFCAQAILVSFELSTMVSRVQKNFVLTLKESYGKLEETVALRTHDALEKSNSLSIALEKNDKTLHELRLQTASRISTVSDLAHQSNNPLHVSYLTLESFKARIHKHRKKLLSIFPKEDQRTAEEIEFISEIEKDFQAWEEDFTKLDLNFDRIRQAILEIRVMSGVDGFHLRYASLDEIIPLVIARLEAAAIGVLPYRLNLHSELQLNTKIFSNPLALMVILERMFRQMMLLCQSPLTVTVRNISPLDQKPGVAFDFSMSRDKLNNSTEIKTLIEVLSHSLRPFGVNLEYDPEILFVTLLPSLDH